MVKPDVEVQYDSASGKWQALEGGSPIAKYSKKDKAKGFAKSRAKRIGTRLIVRNKDLSVSFKRDYSEKGDGGLSDDSGGLLGSGGSGGLLGGGGSGGLF